MLMAIISDNPRQLCCCFAGRGGCHDGRYHGYALYAVGDHLTHGVSVHASDGYAAVARAAHHLVYTVEAEGGERVGLSGGGIHGRYTYIIHVEGIGSDDLIHCFHRKTDNLVAAQQLAGCGIGHIALPDVYTVGIHGESHVYTVIDDERYAEGSQRGFQLAGQLDEFGCGALLLAELHHGDTACSGFTHYPSHVTTTRKGAVGDKVKGEVKGFNHEL